VELSFDILYMFGAAVFAATGAWGAIKHRVDSVEETLRKQQAEYDVLHTLVHTDRKDMADRLARIETKIDSLLIK
jgi:hypothetical protein